jgi:hypothetical protein
MEVPLGSSSSQTVDPLNPVIPVPVNGIIMVTGEQLLCSSFLRRACWYCLMKSTRSCISSLGIVSV